jgi:hypothetical protein
MNVEEVEELAKMRFLETGIKPNQHIRLTEKEQSYDIFNIECELYIGSVCFEENPLKPLYEEEEVQKLEDNQKRVYALIQKVK